VNYTIDPAVRGTVTLRTAAPLARAQLVPALQTLLSQNGATLVQAGELYRVLPSAAVPGTAASGPATAGAAVVPLRYAQADDLAKVLQPFVGAGGRIAAVPTANALLVSGEPDARNSLVELIRAFDIDALAGQSYALLPVTSGGARDFATQLQDALRSEGNSGLAGQVRVDRSVRAPIGGEGGVVEGDDAGPAVRAGGQEGRFEIPSLVGIVVRCDRGMRPERRTGYPDFYAISGAKGSSGNSCFGYRRGSSDAC